MTPPTTRAYSSYAKPPPSSDLVSPIESIVPSLPPLWGLKNYFVYHVDTFSFMQSIWERFARFYMTIISMSGRGQAHQIKSKYVTKRGAHWNRIGPGSTLSARTKWGEHCCAAWGQFGSMWRCDGLETLLSAYRLLDTEKVQRVQYELAYFGQPSVHSWPVETYKFQIPVPDTLVVPRIGGNGRSGPSGIAGR